MADATWPSAVMDVLDAATPGYPDSWQQHWGHVSGDGTSDQRATGASAGTPGSWTPAGATPPGNVADLVAGNPVTVKATPATAWTTGQYVQTGTAGAPGQAHWTGSAWAAGPG